MADDDLTNEDFIELYAYLLEALDLKGFADLRREIEAAAAIPVFEEGAAEDEKRILEEFKGEVGLRAVRRREPHEAFRAAMDTIWTRLTELPQLVPIIEKRLERPAIDIEFRLEEPYSSRQIESVGLRDFRLSEEQYIEIVETLELICAPRTSAQLEWHGNETGNQRRN